MKRFQTQSSMSAWVAFASSAGRTEDRQ